MNTQERLTLEGVLSLMRRVSIQIVDDGKVELGTVHSGMLIGAIRTLNELLEKPTNAPTMTDREIINSVWRFITNARPSSELVMPEDEWKIMLATMESARAPLIDALEKWTVWARMNTSPRQPGTPHQLLIDSMKLIEQITGRKLND